MCHSFKRKFIYEKFRRFHERSSVRGVLVIILGKGERVKRHKMTAMKNMTMMLL